MAHGGDAPVGVIDFSTGISPLAPPDAILAAFRAADVTRYPHPTAAPLRDAIAAAHRCAPNEIVAGSGSVELIWALARAFVGPGRSAAVVTPAFGEYAQAIRASGGRVIELNDLPSDGDAKLDGVSLAFCCRPNNPCLTVAPKASIESLARRHPSTLFAVDEAYLPLYDAAEPMTPLANLIVLRSLTKVFALPGLRLGYLIGEESIAAAVQASLPPWNVSAPACAAGIAALAELHTVDDIRRQISRLRLSLVERLESAGLRVDAAGGTFVLAHAGNARAFCAALLADGLRVRDCSSFGLPDKVRIGVRSDAEQERLAAGVARLMEVGYE